MQESVGKMQEGMEETVLNYTSTQEEVDKEKIKTSWTQVQ